MSKNKNKKLFFRKLSWRLFIFFLLVVIFLGGSYFYFYFFKASEDLYVFSRRKVTPEIAQYNTRIFDKNHVTVNKKEAVAIARDFLSRNENGKKLAELGELQETLSYLTVCHYDPPTQQYFLLLDDPTGDLANQFTTRLCHRVFFRFTDANNNTEVVVGAEEGQIAWWTSGGKIPPEMDYFSAKPAGDFIFKKEIDLDNDGGQETLAIAYPAAPNELGLLPVYFLSYSYVPAAGSWLWSYQFLRSVEPAARETVKDLVTLNLVEDITGDENKEILVTWRDGENSGAQLLVYLHSARYLWTERLYFDDLPRGEVKIKNSRLITTECLWQENDAPCCPTGRLETKYVFDGKRMVKE